MLVHQITATKGEIATQVLTLRDRTIINFTLDADCHSGVIFSSSGRLLRIQNNGSTSLIVGEWLVNGTPADFYVQRTIISGTLDEKVDPGAGFLQLNTSRSYDNIKRSLGRKTTVVFFELSSDASGVPLVASATMRFVSFNESRTQ